MIAERPVVKQEQPPTTAQTPDAAPQAKSRVTGSLFGVFLFFYAAAHAYPGLAATHYTAGQFAVWSATIGWFLAAGPMVLAAYGLWGFPGLAKRWRSFAFFGAVASLALLMASGQWRLWPMMAIDAVIVSAAIDSTTPKFAKKKRGFLKTLWLGFANLLAIALWLYGAAVIVARPWHQQWGATDPEIAKAMPGDKDPRHIGAINHVVTVNATPEKVWPWLIQLGQDKAGFYSYDGLESAIGANVHNVYEIRPEWQHVKAGDFVRACPPDWMGGRWKDETGWHVLQVVPQRLLLLENWGDFWLEPLGSDRTRLGVRTQVGNVPFWAAPIEVFGFEPAHFIMEQKMLTTIKTLAEKPQR